MTAIGSILTALGEERLAQDTGIRHDEARLLYRLSKNTVRDYHEFARITGDYYNHHFTTCVTRGGCLSPGEAQARAKALLDRHYRRKNGDAMSAFADCRDGTNNGLRGVLDALVDALKAEAMDLRVTEVFDQYVSPSSWDEKVEIIRQFIARCGVNLSASIRVDQPERYARDYRELIQAYVEGLRDTSRHFRRL